MVNDYQNYTEVCSLFLAQDYRKNFNGNLLSRCRFLFMAEHIHRFKDTVIAEMRGFSDTNGAYPFWEQVINKFIPLDFETADTLTGIGRKQFIVDLMPRHPIYVDMLPVEAQACIGQTHENTKPAVKLLQKEGFTHHSYVDIFDAGPMLECKLNKIKSIRHSAIATVANITNNNLSEDLYIITNNNLNFRSCIAGLQKDLEQKTVIIDKKTADTLHLDLNSNIRYIKL
jgi:arginine N-succinyltransferase